MLQKLFTKTLGSIPRQGCGQVVYCQNPNAAGGSQGNFIPTNRIPAVKWIVQGRRTQGAGHGSSYVARNVPYKTHPSATGFLCSKERRAAFGVVVARNVHVSGLQYRAKSASVAFRVAVEFAPVKSTVRRSSDIIFGFKNRKNRSVVPVIQKFRRRQFPKSRCVQDFHRAVSNPSPARNGPFEVFGKGEQGQVHQQVFQAGDRPRVRQGPCVVHQSPTAQGFVRAYQSRKPAKPNHPRAAGLGQPFPID